jgi:cell division protein FtsZ
LFERMMGGGNAAAARKEPTVISTKPSATPTAPSTPSAPPQAEVTPAANTQTAPDLTEGLNAPKAGEQDDLLDIPAFLRRQAN